jgi:nucleoside-diphosphate-sugar epimerase
MARNYEKAKAMYADYLRDSRLKFYIHDITEPINAEEFSAITGVRTIDYIIHGAGIAGANSYTSIPTKVLDTAYLGLRNVFEYVKDMSIKPVILITSSAAVYGDSLKEEYIDESDYGYMDLLTVRAIYGESKRISETMSLAYNIEYDVPVKIIRFSNAFGPGMKFDKGTARSDFLASALRGEDIIIQSDGMAKREFLYFTDLVSGLFYVLLYGDTMKPYNIGSGMMYTMKEFAQTVQDVFKEKHIFKIHIQGSERLEDQGAPKVKRLSAAPLMAFGWRPHVALHEAITRFKMSAEDAP